MTADRPSRAVGDADDLAGRPGITHQRAARTAPRAERKCSVPRSRRRMRKRKRCRISVVETDEQPSAPRRLVAALLEHRRSLALPSHSAPLALQPSAASSASQPIDVWTLCDDYGEEDYDSMDNDVHRNAAYTRAFTAVSPRRTRWLEIGCGASATLTRLALANAPSGTHVTAFEVNPESAAAATATLRRAGLTARSAVVVGKSTQPELLPDPAQKFVAVLHEVFGIFASSEGCPQMLGHARSQYLTVRPLTQHRLRREP